MARPLRTLRVGNTVVRRNHLRRRLLQELDQLIDRAERLETRSPANSQGCVEQMISERCQMLAKLCG